MKDVYNTHYFFHPIVAAAALNLFLLIFLILVYCSSFSRPAGFEIFIPRGIENEGMGHDQTIRITAENVFYFNGKVVTLNDLKKALSVLDPEQRNILISVDPQSSMGRVMEVFNLCRTLGKSRVSIVTNQRN